jgi:hypothetical protein
LYVSGVACEILAGIFNFAKLDAMDNHGVRKSLLEFKGIEPWTAETYLLFCLRRADAWPPGDLALEKAIQELKGLESKPSADAANTIAGDWRKSTAIQKLGIEKYMLIRDQVLRYDISKDMVALYGKTITNRISRSRLSSHANRGDGVRLDKCVLKTSKITHKSSLTSPTRIHRRIIHTPDSVSKTPTLREIFMGCNVAPRRPN